MDPRLFWAVLAFIAPALAYFLIFEAILSPVIPDFEPVRAIYGDPARLKAFQQEFPARINLGLTTTVLAAVSVAGFGFAIVSLWRRRGVKIATAIAVLALISGIVSFVANDYTSEQIEAGAMSELAAVGAVANSSDNSVGERMRNLSFKQMSRIAMAATPGLAEAKNAVEFVTAISALVGITATVALIAVLGDVTLGAPGRPLEAAELRHRWRVFRLVLGFAALVFALSVVVVRGFYRWPLTLLAEDDGKLFEATVNSAIQFWGILFTLVLICASLPGFLAIQNDVRNAAEAAGTTVKERKDWREKEGLGVVKRDAFGGLLALATPMLTSPALDALSSVFGAVG